MARASVADGDLVFPDGMRYRLLVLPQVETMTPRLLKRYGTGGSGSDISRYAAQNSPSLTITRSAMPGTGYAKAMGRSRRGRDGAKWAEAQ